MHSGRKPWYEASPSPVIPEETRPIDRERVADAVRGDR